MDLTDPRPSEDYPPVPRNLCWEFYAGPLIAEHRERVAAAVRLGSLDVGRRAGRRARKVLVRQLDERRFTA